MPIEYFYFDLGKVLFQFDYRLSEEKAAKLLNCSPLSIHRAIYNSGLEELFETGFVSAQRFVRESERSLGLDIPSEAFLDATSDMFMLNPGIQLVIDHLEACKIPYGLLSNTCSSHWSWIQRRKEINFDRFRDIVLSYEVGCMKPAPAIYAECERRAKVPANRIGFVDDRLVNVDAAKQRGWQTHLYENVNDTLAWVKSITPESASTPV